MSERENDKLSHIYQKHDTLSVIKFYYAAHRIEIDKEPYHVIRQENVVVVL